MTKGAAKEAAWDRIIGTLAGKRDDVEAIDIADIVAPQDECKFWRGNMGDSQP